MKIMMVICAAFVSGILCQDYFDLPRIVVYILLVLLFAINILCVYKNYKTVYAAAALFLVIGILRCMQASYLSPYDISNYHEKVITVCGVISEVPEIKKNNDKLQIKYVVDVKEVKVSGEKTQPGTGRMLIYLRALPDERVYHYGDKVEANGQVFLPHGYNNPGMVDTAASLRRQGITARMSGAAVRLLESKDTRAFASLLSVWREKVSGIMQSVMPEKDAAILRGMLFGGYEGIPAEVVQDFASTGIVHILSVSGTHIALLAGVMLWLGNVLNLSGFIKVLISVLIISFYAIFAGLSPPVVRALIMGLVSLSAGLFNREKDAANALMLSAFFMLLFEPRLLYDISFQLSFGATAGLVFLYNKTLRLFDFLPEFLAGGLSITIAAQLGVLPFIAWYFSSLSVSSFAANLAVLPILDCVMVFGLIGVMMALIVPFIGKFILVLCSLMLGLSVQLIALLAAVPGGNVYLPACNVWCGMLYFILLAWLYGYLPERLCSLKEIWRRWPRHVAAGSFLGLIMLLTYLWLPKPVMVHFIDVGQGDAALVTTPHGRTIIIDTGGTMGDQFDIGRRVVLPYLKHYGILKVDYMFLTHGHQDHAGGAAGIADVISVGFIGMPREEKLSLAIERLKHSKNYSQIQPLYAGLTYIVDGVAIEILHAGDGKETRTGNESSVLIKISYGKQSFLFTGDLSGEEEQHVLNKNIASAVLKVGHHGAKTSSTAMFLEKVQPKFAVISAGYSNKFGHPHEEVLRRLSFLNTEIHRTDREGAIVFTTNGETLTCDSYIK